MAKKRIEEATPENDTLLNMTELAQELGVSYPTLSKHLKEMKGLPQLKAGKRRLFRRSDVPTLRAFFALAVPADSPAKKAWETRRGGRKPDTADKDERQKVVKAYVASQRPNATPTEKRRATRLLNKLCEKGSTQGKNPAKIRAGIKARAARIMQS